MTVTTPERVVAALRRAETACFSMSCDSAVGKLLAVLAAHLPSSARILELGTGTGVGTAWMVSGLEQRHDVTLVTVERDADLVRLARQECWPSWVQVVERDALEVLSQPGDYNLIFADAQGGKWEGLDSTIGALAPGGLLVVDDMKPQEWWDSEQAQRQQQVRQTLLRHPELVTAELDDGSGVILSTRRP